MTSTGTRRFRSVARPTGHRQTHSQPGEVHESDRKPAQAGPGSAVPDTGRNGTGDGSTQEPLLERETSKDGTNSVSGP